MVSHPGSDTHVSDERAKALRGACACSVTNAIDVITMCTMSHNIQRKYGCGEQAQILTKIMCLEHRTNCRTWCVNDSTQRSCIWKPCVNDSTQRSCIWPSRDGLRVITLARCEIATQVVSDNVAGFSNIHRAHLFHCFFEVTNTCVSSRTHITGPRYYYMHWIT